MVKAGLLESLMNILSRTFKVPNKDKAISISERIKRGSLIISILDLLLKKFNKEFII